MKLKSLFFSAVALLAFGSNASAKTDITSTYLTNAGLTSLSGWSYGDNGYNYTDWKTDGDVPVIEFYHSWSGNAAGAAIGSTKNFHFTQNVTLPAGYYRLAVNAFYREGNGNGKNTKAYIFADNKQQYIIGLSSDGVASYTGGNDLYKAANAFSRGDFSNEFDFHLTESKTITIGFRGYIDTYCSWCILGPVTLYEYTVDDYRDELNTRCSLAAGYTGVIPSAAATALQNRATEIKNATYANVDAVLAAMDELTNLYAAADLMKASFADYFAYKTMLLTLANSMSDSDKAAFKENLATIDDEMNAATTVEGIQTKKVALRSAALTFISTIDGSFDITFLASQVFSDWKKKDGSAAGEVTWAVTNRGELAFAESYESTCETTGTVLYQTVSGLPAGYYQVGMYAMAAYTPGRDFATQATEGDANRSYAFAGDLNDASSILRTGIAIPFKSSFDLSELTTLDVNIHLTGEGSANNLTFGVQKDANGSNWHFAQIISIVYSNSPDLTGLKATRDALVSEAEGLLSGSEANYLTEAQKDALQHAIGEGYAADDFDELNTVTLTTLPNAINTAKQQIQQVKANRLLMIAALERFENDYNLADGTDYRRATMSATAWMTLLEKVNAVSTALDDVTQSVNYKTIKDDLVAQMDATDASIRLFKSYKAMVEGTTALGIAGGYGSDSNMDTDETEQMAIAALNTAFTTYASSQKNDFSVAGFLGGNLDFSAAEGNALNEANSNAVYEVSGWEVNYADADTWTVLRNQHGEHPGQLYMRKNWGSSATTLLVAKQKMLPVGRYTLSFSWDCNMENMTNLSQFKFGEVTIPIGEATDGAKTQTYTFEVTDAAAPFDLMFGFRKTGTGNTPAQMIVDDVTLTALGVDKATGIDKTQHAEMREAEFYDLQGRPVGAHPTGKRLYIVSGKKVIGK